MTGWVILAIVLVVAGAGLWLYRAGRKAEQGASAKVSVEVKDAQLKAANQSRSPDAVSRKLRSGKF